MKRGYDDELVKHEVEGGAGDIGPPMTLGQYGRLAQHGDRFLDPSGNAHTFDRLEANGDVRVLEEDRVHKRVRRDSDGRAVQDGQGQTIIDVRVSPALWSPYVMVRPVPREYQPRARPGVREVRSVVNGGREA